MLKSIIRFLTPLLVLAVTLGAGYLLLGMFQQADRRHEESMKPTPATLDATATSTAPAGGSTSPYPWILSYDPSSSIEQRIPAPRGYERVADLDPEGFAYWLRHLPLKPPGTPVLLYNGQLRGNQFGHVAVVDIDVGTRDLQQCADAIIRLRAEYLYSRQKYRRIQFNFTNGTTVEYGKWAQGIRPIVQGNEVTWTKPRLNAAKDYSYSTFRSYLDTIFTYAGTQSLAQELAPVSPVTVMNIGNVFIQPGSPGHALIVVDMVENKRNGAKAFLLAQSFMPAQDIHVLRNSRPADTGIWPWFDMNFGPQLTTMDWKFNRSDLKRFK